MFNISVDEITNEFFKLLEKLQFMFEILSARKRMNVLNGGFWFG